MSEFDTSVAQKMWQDPALATQIAGMLAPNITHTRNTLYGPRITTIDIRNALSGFGQMYGGLQQKRENEDLMAWMARRAASQQQMPAGSEVPYSEPNVPWVMGEAQGAPTLPARATLPISLGQQATELAKPVETSAQTLMAMSPKQREVYFRGASGATPGPMMAQYARQRTEVEGVRQQQRNQMMLQAVERMAADPSDTESAGIVSSLLGSVRPETATYASKVFEDNRFLMSAKSLAQDYGLPFVPNAAYMAETMRAISVDSVRRDNISKANNAALDTFAKQWAAAYPSVPSKDILGPLRILANTGEPLHPSVVMNAGNAVAMAQFSAEFPEYAKAKGLGQPLSEDLIYRMQASNFWGIAEKDVDAFQTKMLEFKMRRDEYNERNRDRDAALQVRREQLDWHRVEALGQQLHTARQEYVQAGDPVFVTSQLGWLKQPDAQGRGGEFTSEYKSKFLVPAMRKYNDLSTRFEMASDYFGMTHTPAVLMQEHIKEAARTISDIDKMSKTPEERATRLAEFKKRTEAKEYLRNINTYKYGPVVLEKILLMIGDAEKSVPATEEKKTLSVVPPGTSKAVGSSFTERNAENKAILTEILTRKHPGFRMDQLRWEDRQEVLAELNTELARRHGTLADDTRRQEAEVARKRAEAYPPAFGLLGSRTPQSLTPPVGAVGP